MGYQFYKTRSYDTTHNTFGGLIFPSDFNTDCRGKDNNGSPIASRIMSDWKFDQTCKKNAENRDKRAKENNEYDD